MTKPRTSDIFQMQRRMMKLTAMWPEENATVSYKIRTGLSLMFSLGLNLTMAMEAYNDLNDFKKLSEILYIFVNILVYNTRVVSLLVQRKVFHNMLSLLREPIFLSYPDDLTYIMTRRINFVRQFTKIFRVIVFSCIFLIAASPIAERNPLPYPFPYDLGPYRFLMYTFQVIAIGICAYNNLCFDSLLVSFVGVAISHLEILAQKIIRTKKSTETENVAGNLKQCTKHHLAIINLIECINGVFSFSTLSLFIGSAIIICNTLFYFVLIKVGSSQFFMLANYIFIQFGEIFLYCWYGNDVILKSISLGEACYFSDWYNCKKKENKYLLIIMERSRHPLTMTAFKLSVLSLTAFTSIMQWIYSYFALLMNLYKKQDV